MDTSFLRRLSSSPDRPLLPQHERPSSSTYSLQPIPPHQPPSHPNLSPSSSSSSSPPQPPVPSSPPPAPALLALHRHESHLQQHLQHLLDAQSAGLLAGLALPASPTSSTTTSTPTPTPPLRAPPPRRPTVIPVRQPVPPPLGLRGARRGIARALRELRSVKESEAGVLSGEVRRRDEGLGVVRGLEARKRGLEGEIGRARGGEAGGGIEGLKGERERVDAEVRGLEERVRELKARRGGLEREIACRESEAESRVSSWVEAARGVDRAVEGFLSGLERRGEGGVAALPVGRRTLEMCRGEWEGEREALVRRREGVQREQEALDEGVRVWEEVVGVVAGVEARLREEMRGRGGEEGMRGVVEQMDQAVEILEGKVELAHARGWKLLVCAVGAEMEAFRQGRDVLRAALDGVGGEDGSRGDGEGDATGGHANDGAGSANGRAAVDEDFGGLSIGGVPVREHRVRPPSLLDRSEDEDDGPGPDFLTSHQEEDE